MSPQEVTESRHVGWEVCVDQLPLCFLPYLAIQGSNLRINDENWMPLMNSSTCDICWP